jgi:hypothetical protein
MMLTGPEWAGLGVATTLGIILIARRQLRINRETLALAALKASPKIGTEIHIDKRQVNPSGFPPFYYLIVTLHNHGELPAKQVKGRCRLFSPTNPLQEHTIPIGFDLLGASPRKLAEYRLDDVFIDPQRPQTARFNAEIEFDYLGREGLEDKPEHCSIGYEYDGPKDQFNAFPASKI